MQYRRFGKLDWQVSALGMGTMRLPVFNKDTKQINKELAIAMIRHAIDNGVNYVDTAYMYHGGNSEILVGQALQNGYRQKVRLADKMPPFNLKSASDFDRIFNEQLQRLQTDKIEFYLLHSLDKTFWPMFQRFKVLEWAEKKMAAGQIDYLGFSFHDDYPVFKEIIDSYDNWTFCQIQYNYMDEKIQAGTRGLRYAAGKGLAVVVMEPLRGGKLSRPPASVTKLFDTLGQQSSPSEWALRWVWHHPEATLALSGMSDMSQVADNIKSAEKYGNAVMTPQELDLIRKARAAYRKLIAVPCTGCGYCLPCPNNVDIPRIFGLYNDGVMYEARDNARLLYGLGYTAVAENQRPGKCKDCKKCEEVCPQKISIASELKKAKVYLEPG